MRLEYHPVKKFTDIAETIRIESQKESNDFVEGLMFSKNEAVIMTGQMVDEAEPRRVRSVTTASSVIIDYRTVRFQELIFRYNFSYFVVDISDAVILFRPVLFFKISIAVTYFA